MMTHQPVTFMTDGLSLEAVGQYPSKPVRVVLPFRPGGAATAIGQAFAARLSKDMGQSFVVDNVPGGSTAVGTELVAGSAPDGHTLIITNTALVIAQTLTPKLSYDTLRDLVGVSTLSRSERVLAIHPSLPVSDLQELIAYAKRFPNRINVCCHGTSNHLENVLFMQAAGVELTVAPYSGGGSADKDFLEGKKLQMVFNTVERFAPHIRAGRLRGIAYTGDARHPSLPDVPTFREVGQNFRSANWYMLLAPAGTPAGIVERLNGFVRTAQSSIEVKEVLGKEGVDAFPNTISETNSILRTQLERFDMAVSSRAAGTAI